MYGLPSRGSLLRALSIVACLAALTGATQAAALPLSEPPDSGYPAAVASGTQEAQVTPLAAGGVSSNQPFDPRDAPRAQAYMNTQERRDLLPVLLKAGRPPSLPGAAPYVVQPILFIASDLAESPGNTQAINSTFELLRRWYSGALELRGSGYTFRVAEPIVFHAPQPFYYYKCPGHETSCDNYDGIWGNVQVELRDAGYPIWSYGTDFAVFVKGAGGWAGGSCVPNCGVNYPAPGPAGQGGLFIVGDWALDAISGTLNSECFEAMGTACYADPQRGAVGHELGHTFGLAHALDLEGSITSSWWNFPNVSLFGDPGNDEQGVLRNSSPYFLAHACDADVQADQVTMPETVQRRAQFAAAFSVTNYGFCRWSLTKTGLALTGDNVWGVKKAALGGEVRPAQHYTFSLVMTAPAREGTFGDYWRMQTQNRYFGPTMGHAIAVVR